MAATDYAPPQPTTEHQRLAEHAGVWNVDCTFYMDPSQPPMEVKGKETIEMFGPFWTTSVFETEMMGVPFKGSAMLGFEPHTGEYVATWIDTMNPNFFKLSGKFDASGKVLEMTGKAKDCMSDALADYRTTEEHIGPDERVFEMFTTMPDGTEVKMFRHVYKRA